MFIEKLLPGRDHRFRGWRGVGATHPVVVVVDVVTS
jgi:hypothetical protein